jgi:SRSO17 transposase
MDATQIRRLGPLLDRFLASFADCFSRQPTREHLAGYVKGLLSDLPRKSAEPLALDQGIPVRTLQEFLAFHRWDHLLMRDRLQQRVAAQHACEHSVGVIDDTGCPKKGDKTPGVQRQYCGASGTIDNCVVTVHLGYAAGDFRCLLDSDLYLPEPWADDRPRCRQAGIPDTLEYRPKWQIALELYDRAVVNGVRFAWLTFDADYGAKPGFLRGLHKRHQLYVAEVPCTFRGWVKLPRLTKRGWRGRPASTVESLLQHSRAFTDQPWVAYRIKDGSKGPMVWEVKHVRLYPQNEDGDPRLPVHLVIARNALNRSEVKYLVSNAPAGTPVKNLLLVAFTRWSVERCFEDEKTELGFDHFEGRSYTGLIRHQRLVALTHLFCVEACERWRGEKSGADTVPGEDGIECLGAVVGAEPGLADTAFGEGGPEHRAGAATQRRGAAMPHTRDEETIAASGQSAELRQAV